jgi:arabinose-5-phosphate isomerase
MNHPVRNSTPTSSGDLTSRRLQAIRDFMFKEAAAITLAAESLDASVVKAAVMTSACRGCVIVTGVGKAGLVGQKLVATLASTGTPAHFLHPSEAVHGDLGRVRPDDLVWAISNSGRSEEVLRIAEPLRRETRGLIAITADDDNPLSAIANVTVAYGPHREIDPNGLAPTATTTVMMAVGDAIAMMASSMRDFTADDFARLHPGGSLGRKLSVAKDLMRHAKNCRVTESTKTIREAMTTTASFGRRCGAVMVVDDRYKLVGIFTDSDLARLFQTRHEQSLDDSIAAHMTSPCISASVDEKYESIMQRLTDKRISELPVIDSKGVLVGMIDITDLITLPTEPAPQTRRRLSVISPDDDFEV